MNQLAMTALLGLCLSSCVVETHGTGTLTVDWTIENGKSASTCRVAGVDQIAIDVYDDDSSWHSSYSANCEDFATSIDLDSGHYSGSAVLLDYDGNEITTTVDLGPMRIYSDEELVVPIEFPADSFR